MRLINVHTLEVEDFSAAPRIPRYAILSHTWGKEEVSFEEWKSLGSAKNKIGWHKIISACQKTKNRNLRYLWCDTNCIDKSSSAELSEAIHSMFKWYQNAEVCFAYLEDVDALEDMPGSRWFTRGWTLQELLAPRNIRFYNKSWECLGSKITLVQSISDVTGILQSCLLWGFHEIQTFSVAYRMSWLSKRKTTRVEDMAYCMLGIFNVNMSLLYGEGYKAFHRLQEEIIRVTSDETIFAWSPSLVVDCHPDTRPRIDLIAPLPSAFACAKDNNIRRLIGNGQLDVSRTVGDTGLRGSWDIIPHQWDADRKWIVLEAERWEDEVEDYIGLAILITKSCYDGRWIRAVKGGEPITISAEMQSRMAPKAERLVIGARPLPFEDLSWSTESSLKAGSESNFRMRATKPGTPGVVGIWVCTMLLLTPSSNNTCRVRSCLHFELVNRKQNSRLYCLQYPATRFCDIGQDILTIAAKGCTPQEHRRLKKKREMISRELEATVMRDDLIIDSNMSATGGEDKLDPGMDKLCAELKKDPQMQMSSIFCLAELEGTYWGGQTIDIAPRISSRPRGIQWLDLLLKGVTKHRSRPPLKSIGV